MKRTRKPNLISLMMAEHVEMPGFPQIIVTRDFVYQFLRGCGWNPSERGFGSVDFLTFRRAAVAEALTDEKVRDRLLAKVRKSYLREERSAA